MQLFAHATIHEIPIALVIFLTGVYAGPWLAQFVYRRLMARRK